MASASFVEIISHFAGYLQIFHDVARDRIQYHENLAPRPSDDYTTLRPNYDYRVVSDDWRPGRPGAGTDTGRSRAFVRPGHSSRFVHRTTIPISFRARRRRTCRCRNRPLAGVEEAVPSITSG